MAEFRMPSLGADMDYGTLVEWTLKPGDHIHRGDIIALVETDKGLIEIEVFEDGVVESLAASPGERLEVGALMARIASDGERPATAEPPQTEEAPRPPTPPPVIGQEGRKEPLTEPPVTASAREVEKVRASPRARRRAKELGVDLAGVTPDEGGVIRVADVERAAAPIPPGAATRTPPHVEPPTTEASAGDRAAAMRRVIGAAMARSKREIPHYYLETHIDVGCALTWLAERNRERPVTQRLLASALLVKGLALAVCEVPELNGYWIEGSFHAAERVHVGMAISLRQGGLVAPALHDVDKKPLDELMKEMLDLTKRARSGVLRSSEIADATITVTSLGDQGVESVFGIIYPPQVALVGFGKVVERPWAAAGMIGIRPIVSATLSADHRASDGHRGARFLAALDRFLQEPEKL